nr:PREDICTED: FXYD domain-containing ion transport regulator 11-like [Paralichthys olivaceus]
MRVVLKMGQLDLVAVMAVLFTLFMETEASPFVYNYDRLRIGGLVIAFLLVMGGLSVLLYNRCSRKEKKAEDDNSEI